MNKNYESRSLSRGVNDAKYSTLCAKKGNFMSLTFILFCSTMFMCQDAHELYHVFTETLEEEAAKYPSVLPLFDAHKIEVKHQ